MSDRTKAGMLALILCVILATITLKLLSPPTALPIDADKKDFSALRAMEHLNVIAQKPHSTGTEEGQKVIDYVSKELIELGLEVTIQDTLVVKYSDRNSSIRLSRVKNVFGRLKGTDNSKAVMLMAHHDSQPNTPAAADDGYGVVSILEGIRAAKKNGPLKNDLLVLITDSEENGLLGAKGFVDYHPALEEIGVLLNIEARGNSGVSVSFEINPENGWIVRQFAQSAPYPIANSMGYEVYKILPNDTDFSEFRKTPIAGVNSANIEGFVNYHSMTDTPENVNPNTLQHHGSNMLGMLLHFGNIQLDKTKAPDAIFFNPIGNWLIVYPASYDYPFIFLTLILFIITVIYGIKMNEVNLSQIFIGIGYFLVILAISGIGSYLLQQAILWMYPHYTSFYANNFYNIAYYFYAFIGFSSLFYALFFGYHAKMSGLSLSLGGALMLVMTMFGLYMSLPTATYLLYYPLGLYFIVQLGLLFFNINAQNNPWKYSIGQFLALAPAITLWTQTIYLLFITFGLTEAIIAPVVLFSFLAILTVPIISMISLGNKQILNIVALLVFTGGLLLGHFSSDITKEKPLQTYMMYGADMDNNKSVWATNKQNEWIKQYIPDTEIRYFDEIYPEWDWKIWKADAPTIAVQPTNIQTVKDTLIDETQRILEFFIQPTNFKNSLEIFLEEGSSITDLTLNDLALTATPNKQDGTIYLNFFAPPTEGFYLKMKSGNKNQKIKIVDRTIGLPPSLLKFPLPKNMIPGPGRFSNVTLVKKTHEF